MRCILHRWQYLLDRGHTARDEGGGHGVGLDFFLGIWIAWVALGRFESLWIALSGVPSRHSDHLSSQDVHAVATLVPTIRWGGLGRFGMQVHAFEFCWRGAPCTAGSTSWTAAVRLATREVDMGLE